MRKHLGESKDALLSEFDEDRLDITTRATL